MSLGDEFIKKSFVFILYSSFSGLSEVNICILSDFIQWNICQK